MVCSVGNFCPTCQVTPWGCAPTGLCRGRMNRAGSTSALREVQTTSMSCIQNIVQHREPPQSVQPCYALGQPGPGTQQGKQQQCCTSNLLRKHQTILSCNLVPLSEGFSWIYLVTAEPSFCAWFTIFSTQIMAQKHNIEMKNWWKCSPDPTVTKSWCVGIISTPMFGVCTAVYANCRVWVFF